MTNNTAMKNAMALSFKTVYEGGVLEIRGANGIGLLVEINGLTFSSPSNGSIEKAGTWSGVGLLNGVARVGRFVSLDFSKTTEFTISTAGGGGEMIIGNDNVQQNGTVRVSTFILNF